MPTYWTIYSNFDIQQIIEEAKKQLCIDALNGDDATEKLLQKYAEAELERRRLEQRVAWLEMALQSVKVDCWPTATPYKITWTTADTVTPDARYWVDCPTQANSRVLENAALKMDQGEHYGSPSIP